MASLLKAKVASASQRLSGESGGESESEVDIANKYMLRVSAGPSYDYSTHKPVYVNSDDYCEVDNDFLTAKIKVRIRNYHGLPKGSKSHSPYFDDPLHAKDQYSIGFSFVPKKDLPSTDLVWGNDFEHPVRDRLPPGFNTAFKIVKEFIDPGLSCDAYADEPWLYGPALSCWFAFRIGEKDQSEFPAPEEEHPMTDGADGSGTEVRQKLKLPESGDKRRKHFLDASHRQELTFEKGRCYQGDFYNPYIDFSKFALKLPGFSLGVIKYINDKTHHLRYVFKNRATGELLFVVVLTLLFGDELQQAIRDDQGSGQRQAPKVAEAGPNEEAHAEVGAAEPDRAPPRDHADGDSSPTADPDAQTTLESQSPSKQTPNITFPLKQASRNSRQPQPEDQSPTKLDNEKPSEKDGARDELAEMLKNTASIDGRDQKAGFLS